MTKEIKVVNEFIKKAPRKELESVMSEICFSDRQKEVFELCCIRKLGIDFVADTLNVCSMVVNRELKTIKNKIFLMLN